MKRILDCRASDFEKMNKEEWKQAISAAEEQPVIAETVAIAPPLYPEVTDTDKLTPHNKTESLKLPKRC